MKQGYFLLIILMFSMGSQAQTLKETIRGKFGEYQGTSETRVRGGKNYHCLQRQVWSGDWNLGNQDQSFRQDHYYLS